MATALELFGIAAAVMAVGAAIERARLQRYWRRACSGFAWRRRFPNTTSQDIRAFLSAFTEAFAFPESRRLCFAPDDKPLEVYRALYPVPWLVGDSSELETFVEGIRLRFGVDLLPHWRKDITLGELYAVVSRTSA